MSDEKTKGRGGCVAIGIAVAVLLLLPVAYFLSIGPAYWLAHHGYLSPRPYSVYIWPVCLVMDYIQPFKDAMNWYASLFD